jgi:succinyl-diaminopimelate desuccinylase
MKDLKSLLSALIAFESVTPKDENCQVFMMNHLSDLGFRCKRLDKDPVSNFYAEIGDEDPLLVFAGHTDVVAVGDESKWNSNPFELTEKDGILYGRGTADMKGSLACMMLAAKSFIHDHTHFKGRLGFLITSGEEGDDFDCGTPYVMEQLDKQGIRPDYCIVGEPSSTNTVGDVVKVGRRGSLTAKLTLHGKQGHIAYPHLAENPIHTISPALAELVTTEWDKGNDYFPPTSLQVTHVDSGGHGGNVIPGDLTLQFNVRYSSEQTAEGLKKAIMACFAKHKLNPEIEWRLNGEPFLTEEGALVNATVDAIESITGKKPELSTSGGTSDGRFIAPYGVEVVELGPVNATIHQVNECVSLKDLETLTACYEAICEALLK